MLRLFIAIFPDHDAATALSARAIGAAHLSDAWRVTSIDHLHLTLHFLGTVERRRSDEIIESVERSAAGLRSFTLRADRVATLPATGDPRVLAALTDAPPDMLEIQRRAFHRLATREQRKRGNRFKPHLTIARASVSGVERCDGASFEPVTIPVREICLVRSELSQTGARYEVVHRVGLGPERR